MATNIRVNSYRMDNEGRFHDIECLDRDYAGNIQKLVNETDLAKIEQNKTATITKNGIVEIIPTSPNDAMAKATITVNVQSTNAQKFPVYSCYLADTGDDSEAENISESYALLLFSDDDMKTPVSPADLSDDDTVYGVYVDDSRMYSYGVDAEKVDIGGACVQETLPMKVDHISNNIMCFDARDTDGHYIFINPNEETTSYDWFYILTNWRYH